MEIVLALGLVAWLLQMLARQKVIIPTAPLLWPFLLFLGGVDYPGSTLSPSGPVWLKQSKWVEMLALYLLWSPCCPPRQIRRVVVVMMLTGIAQASWVYYQFIFKVGPPGFLLFDGRFLRAYGTFAQPNPYGRLFGPRSPTGAVVDRLGLQ